MNQDHDLTSQELEQTLELLREFKILAVTKLGRVVDVLILDDGINLGRWYELPATIDHIRSYLPLMSGENLEKYPYQDVLDYFQNLKRQRNFKALLS